MKFGAMADTHKDEKNAITHIISTFKREGVQVIIHAGDIDPKHLDANLFGNLPVICALTEGQDDERFTIPPNRWCFTRPDQRIVSLGGTKVYVGHKRAYEYWKGSGYDLMLTMETIRKDHDGLRFVFCGHTHRQLYVQNHVACLINPGAVENSLWGYEYMIGDTETGQAKFSRIMPEVPVCQNLKIGVISDSRNISDLNPEFWPKLAGEFLSQGIRHVIHCGNLARGDVGKEDFRGFEVYFNLEKAVISSTSIPGNWHRIDPDCPVVPIMGYNFCVQHNLGESLMDKNERDILRLSLDLTKRYPQTDYVLFGLTHQAFLEENEQLIVLNPGDVVRDQSYATIEVPRNEVTFAKIPRLPLVSLN